MAALHTWNINVAHSQEMHGNDMLRFTRINNSEGFHMMNALQGDTLCPWMRFENIERAAQY